MALIRFILRSLLLAGVVTLAVGVLGVVAERATSVRSQLLLLALLPIVILICTQLWRGGVHAIDANVRTREEILTKKKEALTRQLRERQAEDKKVAVRAASVAREIASALGNPFSNQTADGTLRIAISARQDSYKPDEGGWIRETRRVQVSLDDSEVLDCEFVETSHPATESRDGWGDESQHLATYKPGAWERHLEPLRSTARRSLHVSRVRALQNKVDSLGAELASRRVRSNRSVARVAGLCTMLLAAAGGFLFFSRTTSVTQKTSSDAQPLAATEPRPDHVSPSQAAERYDTASRAAAMTSESAQAAASAFEDFPAVSSSHDMAEYKEQNLGTIAMNSDFAESRDLRVVGNKWIFRSALGHGPVLVTHPRNTTLPSVFRVNTGGHALFLSVHAHALGDSRIEVWADTMRLLSEDVVGAAGWITRTVCLPAGMRDVEVRHVATGWYYEYLYWSALGPAPGSQGGARTACSMG